MRKEKERMKKEGEKHDNLMGELEGQRRRDLDAKVKDYEDRQRQVMKQLAEMGDKEVTDCLGLLDSVKGKQKEGTTRNLEYLESRI
jgi:hypothetical protein